MAKKTNKTDHVLNLLSGGETKKEASKYKEENSLPPVIPKEGVLIVESVEEEQKVADTIRESLEQELAAMEEKRGGRIIGQPNTQELNSIQKNGEIPPSEEEIQEIEFVSVNVMEKLVLEKVFYYMEKFGICMCTRCVADVKALALSQLPPKYIVVNEDTVSPLINFHSNQYTGQITVELTRACMKVGENPHHIPG